jgi:hypothetical protein
MAFTTAGLANGGVTSHYRFQYDDSLQQSSTNPNGPEPARTNQVIAACDSDFSLMSSWFGNISLGVNSPIQVSVTPDDGGASWSLSGKNLSVTIKPSSAGATLIRYLMVSEIVEVFMLRQNRGWFGQGTEGSQGEGLSRFLGGQFLAINNLGPTPTGFTNSNAWLASPRADFVNHIASGDDGPDQATGCALLFIYYLFAQLGYGIEGIVGAAAKPLSGVYRNLTGATDDPFRRSSRRWISPCQAPLPSLRAISTTPSPPASFSGTTAPRARRNSGSWMAAN